MSQTQAVSAPARPAAGSASRPSALEAADFTALLRRADLARRDGRGPALRQPGGPVDRELRHPGGPVDRDLRHPGGPLDHELRHPGGPLDHELRHPGGPLDRDLRHPGGPVDRDLRHPGGPVGGRGAQRPDPTEEHRPAVALSPGAALLWGAGLPDSAVRRATVGAGEATDASDASGAGSGQVQRPDTAASTPPGSVGSDGGTGASGPAASGGIAEVGAARLVTVGLVDSAAVAGSGASVDAAGCGPARTPADGRLVPPSVSDIPAVPAGAAAAAGAAPGELALSTAAAAAPTPSTALVGGEGDVLTTHLATSASAPLVTVPADVPSQGAAPSTGTPGAAAPTVAGASGVAVARPASPFEDPNPPASGSATIKDGAGGVAAVPVLASAGRGQRPGLPTVATGPALLDPTEAGAALVGAGGPASLPGPGSLLATAGPGAPATGALLGALPQLVQSARTGSSPSRLVLRLDPPELGQVHVVLTLRAEQVSLTVAASTAAGASSLAGQQETLADALLAAGLSLLSFTVREEGSRREPPEPHRVPAERRDATAPGAVSPRAERAARTGRWL